MTKYLAHMFVLIAAAVASGCTMANVDPPPLSGPSEMSLSLTVSANPDVLSLDGSSQTLVTVEARDVNGQLKPNVPLRVEILVNDCVPPAAPCWQAVDYGTISARNLTTGSNGRSSFTYTAPPFVEGNIPDVQLSVIPTGAETGFDASALLRRLVTIRLVEPGVIADAPTPDFSFTPASPAAFSDVRFDASTSTGGLGAVITGYVWDFGDGTSGTGIVATHRYNAAGTYQARLIVTNSNGVARQITKSVVVGGGAAPTASFLSNPSAATVGQTIFFNASASAAGPGHTIARYDWDFGDGTRRSGSSVSKSYTTAGTYSVVLTVTDEVGQTDQAVQSVTVGGSPATAVFTYSPTDPVVGTDLIFNGSESKGEGPNAIVRYEWDFGCTVGVNCTRSTFTSTSSATGTTRYTQPFTYTVRLTVTDSKGKRATTTQEVGIDP